MTIERLNTYDDPRFPQAVLNQHGAFLVDGMPCAIEITGADCAVVTCERGACADDAWAALDEFRFYAEHITRFFDPQGRLLRVYPPVRLFRAAMEEIQPSQFFVDEDKLRAVSAFVHAIEDVVIPVARMDGRWVACDGHTRLRRAWQLGFREVLAFETAVPGDYLAAFVREAQRRGVYAPDDLTLLPHAEYDLRWNRYCDDFFARHPG